LGIVSSINDKLNTTNQKIMGLINGGQKGYDVLVSKNSNSHDELIQNYKVLQTERKMINKMLAEFDDLEESQIETDLMTNQNYYSFMLLSVIAVAVCVILFYFAGSSSNTSNTSTTSNTIQQGGKSIFSLGLLGIFFSMITIVILILLIKSKK
jgi:small-conductance mechanosensitive channel